MQIGNWEVTPNAIVWKGIPEVEYEIHRTSLVELGNDERSQMYDWLLHLVQKTWITKEDIYSLNNAFIYAVEYYGLDFNTSTFVNTLREQQKYINLLD